MKVIIAIDSFKGSLSSMEAGNIISHSIKAKHPSAETLVYPLADGGEGTVEALVEGMGGSIVNTKATGPLGTKVACKYGIILERKLGIIEIAEVAGLTLIPEHLKNPLNTTTYGVGELIADAINRGCRDFIIGLGGSGTNEAGIGMLQALGYVFKDKDNQTVGNTGKDLVSIKSIDESGVNPLLKQCGFHIACDVNNPLYGPLGATEIYGTQKGLSQEEIGKLDKSMEIFAQVVKDHFKKDNSNVPGTGAAGGLGYAFHTFLDGQLEPGRDIILKEIGMEKAMIGADYVITGEGRLDLQTAMGKGPIGVAKLGKKYGAKVIALAGGITKDINKCNEEGIDTCLSIVQGPCSIEEAMDPDNARYNLKTTVEQLFALL